MIFVSVFYYANAQTEETETKKIESPVTEEELISPTLEKQLQPVPEKEVLKEEMKLEEEGVENPAEMKLESNPVESKAEPVPGAEIYLEQTPGEEVKKPKKKKHDGLSE
ncbi:MAG: hypothetical protein A2W91_12165 [Bacteroidetes bacterium GWF2_38_335]|nr:MAG: hypothetical protein A2W91_12165 [Bacteroidetes bacterium GWF2_38_335]OFY76927.1 MAG: hypothetical protein A2281_00280 [Bacteroidetes bacterium RIFOXYA12_FULL_38_20]HBS86777.1 hypothetical protein [Bacteroidales bacterium]